MKKITMEKIIQLFLLSNPILDMLTAIGSQVFHFDLTIGMIVRVLFLAFACFYLLFLYHGTSKKKILFALGILLLYLIAFFSVTLSTKGFSALRIEGVNAIKTFYFPIILLTFFALFEERKKIVPKNFIPIVYGLYLLGIFLPNLLGLGFSSYDVTKEGNLGFFLTANEVGAILSILMPFFFYHLVKKKNMLLFFLAIILLLYVLFTIGTKGPLLAFGIIFLVAVIYGFCFFVKKKEYKKVALLGSSVVGLCFFVLLLLPKTTFYENIKIHLDFLKVDHISEIFQDEKLVDHFIFSSRLKFMKETGVRYQKASLGEKLLGIGYSIKESDHYVEEKMVEMDYVDLFYRHGVIGFLLTMGLYLAFCISAVKQNIKEKDKRKKITFFLSFFLSILLAFFTGHVLLSPAVSIYVALLLTDRNKEMMTN